MHKVGFIGSTGSIGGGIVNWNGNYATETYAYIQPPSDEVWEIYRMIVHIEDSGNFSAAGYGAGSALTGDDGIRVMERTGTDIETLWTCVEKVQVNSDWSKYCHDVVYMSYGAGNNHLSIRWTFARSGKPIKLIGSNNENLAIGFTGDYTHLVDHQFLAQGIRTS